MIVLMESRIVLFALRRGTLAGLRSSGLALSLRLLLCTTAMAFTSIFILFDYSVTLVVEGPRGGWHLSGGLAKKKITFPHIGPKGKGKEGE